LIATIDGVGTRLLHLFTVPELRRRGIASGLLNAFVDGLPLSLSAGAMRYAFAATEGDATENGLLQFLTHRGFAFTETDGGLYRTTLGALSDASFWKKPFTPSPDYVPLSKMTAFSVREFNRKTVHRLAMMAEPYAEEGLLPEISHALVLDGVMEGIAAVSARGGGMEVVWLYCIPQYTARIPGLLKAVYQVAIRSYPPEAPLCISAINSSSEGLVEKLCPDAEKIPLIEAEASYDSQRVRSIATAELRALDTESESDLLWWKNLWK
jgi:hypothetical protein